MEGLKLNIIPLVSFVMLFIPEFLLFHVVNRIGGFRKLLSRYQSFIESQQVCDCSNISACSSDETSNDIIRSKDAEMVMEKLGLFGTHKDENLKGSLCTNEISNLFEEREPSLEELKEAFDVFDENKDGFIDAEELHRVTSILGLKEGLYIENCRMMIRAFDQNGDDRINFNEFVNVMENGFC